MIQGVFVQGKEDINLQDINRDVNLWFLFLFFIGF
jgi:hypothetical protein